MHLRECVPGASEWAGSENVDGNLVCFEGGEGGVVSAPFSVLEIDAVPSSVYAGSLIPHSPGHTLSPTSGHMLNACSARPISSVGFVSTTIVIPTSQKWVGREGTHERNCPIRCADVKEGSVV